MKLCFDRPCGFQSYSHVNNDPANRSRQPLGSLYFHNHFFLLFGHVLQV